MRKIYSNENIAVVNIAQDLLEQSEIESFIKNEFMGSGGHVGLGTALIELWIYDDSKAEQAAGIIRDALVS